MTDDEAGSATPPPAEDEFKAMAGIAAAVDPVADAAVRRRVMLWALDRYGVEQPRPNAPGVARVGRQAPEAVVEPGEHADFAEMFHAAGPRNDRERLLAAGYWLQVRQSEQNLHADNVNEILNPIGQRIARVRNVLPALLAGRPALVIRVGKAKGTKGRVTFRLTTAGIAAVDAALAAGGFEGGA